MQSRANHKSFPYIMYIVDELEKFPPWMLYRIQYIIYCTILKYVYAYMCSYVVHMISVYNYVRICSKQSSNPCNVTFDGVANMYPIPVTCAVNICIGNELNFLASQSAST